MDSKKDIRKRVLNLRNSMKETEWEANSNRIYEKVVTHSFFLEEDHIYCFVNYQKEVNTKRIIEKAWSLNKTVLVPKIYGDEMKFHKIESFNELQEGYKGILEPSNDNIFDSAQGLVIMPGVAFDKKRNRVGYGKGFYDRFLEKHPNLKTMGIAFQLQVLENVPFDSQDIKPEILITEEEIYV